MIGANLQQAWCHICLVLGLQGNIFVLHGTIVHNAIKLDAMSKWIIKNLAVFDIFNCMFVLLPVLIIQYAGNVWILGNTFCKVSAAYRYSFLIANIFLINALSSNKLYRCLFPLRDLVPSRRRMCLTTIVVVFFSLIPMGWILFGLANGSHSVKFQPSRSSCEQTPLNSLKTSQTTILGDLSLVLCVALPMITLILSNTVLVGYAMRKSNTRINKVNILTVIFVTVSFLVSFVPLLIVLFLRVRGKTRDAAWAATFLSSWINPFVYVAVNPSFRKYAKNRALFWRTNQITRQFSSYSTSTEVRAPPVDRPLSEAVNIHMNTKR